MPLDPQADEIMKRSPHPLPWTIALFILTILTFTLQSVIIGIVLGVSIGLYFGNYRGRFAIMKAWRIQMDADHERHMEDLREAYGLREGQPQ